MISKMYTDYIKELPAPTSEQIKNYVEFVAREHSWYKHLPVDRSYTFMFYLDPNVVRKLVTIEEDTFFSKKTKFIFEKIEDDSFSKKRIEEYGYWRYNFIENNTLMESILSHEPNRYIGLNIIDSNKLKEPLSFKDLKDISCPIPKDLINKFSFNMSRYLHPTFNKMDDYFDEQFPEKSFSQMHKEIISDLNEHLTSIINTIYNS